MRQYSLLFLFFLPLSAATQIAVSLDNMDVLYPSGAKNTLSVVVSDLPDSVLALEPSMGEIRRTEPGKYLWTICHRDTNFATLAIRNVQNDSVLQTFRYRVNRIPDPTPMLATPNSGKMGKGEFKRVGGLALVLEQFDFDMRCNVRYFSVQRITKGQDTVVKRNVGGRYTGDVYDLIAKAIPGDEYGYFEISYTCGCDPTVRYLSDELHFKIK